jgi:phosphopantothenoylcysteine decarboxylase/phosphopantothenate--cysteine ligase
VKFVVTAGPTREPLDPVRYLSNRSSGKMGYAIAAAALEAQHEVVLITGPVALAAPRGAQVVHVTTGEEMYTAAVAHFAHCDVFVMCAAVCDYQPVQYTGQKMKKPKGPFSLALQPTRDVLASLTSRRHDCLVVGFAAETQALHESAKRKLKEKNCDLLVGNEVGREGIGMDAEENELTIFFPDGAERKLPRKKKIVLARDLLKIISEVCEKRLTKKM